MSLSDKIGKYRRKKSVRLAIIILLIAIVVFLYFFYGKLKVFLIAIFALLLVALGLEATGNDWDMGKLIETGSFQESKVEQTDNGTWLIGEECQKEKLNCSNFEYQQDAQDLFEKCGGLSNDVHRLDGDKDGIVCEALPSK